MPTWWVSASIQTPNGPQPIDTMPMGARLTLYRWAVNVLAGVGLSASDDVEYSRITVQIIRPMRPEEVEELKRRSDRAREVLACRSR